MLPGPDRLPPLTRRSFVLGSAGLVVLAACGGDDDVAVTESTADGAALGVVQYFERTRVPAGVEVRLPFGLVDADGVTMTDVPETLTVAFAPIGGAPGPSSPVRRRGEGVPRPFFPAVTTFEETGNYEMVADVEGRRFRGAVTVVPAAEVRVPGPGDPLPSQVTPTVADPGGVDPICTREPACPLHTVSLDRVLQSARPVALMVSTPAFCQTAVCGPVLDLLLDQQQRYGDRVAMVHAEVYTDTEANELTPTVQALGLTWEPSLFLVDAGGLISERLDFIFDRTEVTEALDRLVG